MTSAAVIWPLADAMMARIAADRSPSKPAMRAFHGGASGDQPCRSRIVANSLEAMRDPIAAGEFPMFSIAIRRLRYYALMSATGIAAGIASAETPVLYQRPAAAITDVLNAPTPPTVLISPTRDFVMLVQSQRYPPIADVAAPMLRLAGL